MDNTIIPVAKGKAPISISCEGCVFCGFICPKDPIEMEENVSIEYRDGKVKDEIINIWRA